MRYRLVVKRPTSVPTRSPTTASGTHRFTGNGVFRMLLRRTAARDGLWATRRFLAQSAAARAVAGNISMRREGSHGERPALDGDAMRTPRRFEMRGGTLDAARHTREQKMKLSIGAVTSAVAATVLLAVGAITAGQTLQTERVMREKLSASQQLLAALVTSDWVALDRHSRKLEALTNDPGWDAMRLPEFSRHTTPFQRALQAVAAAAGQRDQPSALAAYTDLVGACVECHRYVGRARLAARDRVR
jgi:hypothetical protein